MATRLRDQAAWPPHPGHTPAATRLAGCKVHVLLHRLRVGCVGWPRVSCGTPLVEHACSLKPDRGAQERMVRSESSVHGRHSRRHLHHRLRRTRRDLRPIHDHSGVFRGHWMRLSRAAPHCTSPFSASSQHPTSVAPFPPSTPALDIQYRSPRGFSSARWTGVVNAQQHEPDSCPRLSSPRLSCNFRFRRNC